MDNETYQETKLQREILALQNQMRLAIENGEVAYAHELESEIDELQAELVRLNQGKL